MIEGVKGDWLTLERIPTYDNIVAFMSFEVIYLMKPSFECDIGSQCINNS